MVFLSKSELDRLVGQSYKTAAFSDSLQKSVTAEKLRLKTYDVFLSHSYLDKDTILKVNYALEDLLGLSVFVDWIERPDIDRNKVTPATAAELRDVMDRCSSLIYAVSPNAADSKWMPWELGYSDAKHGRVAILPITDSTVTIAAYEHQEFVGIYPVIDITEGMDIRDRTLWVNDRQNSKRYSRLKEWQRTGQLPVHS